MVAQPRLSLQTLGRGDGLLGLMAFAPSGARGPSVTVAQLDWPTAIPSPAEQAAATQRIDKSDLQPGDLVFFNTMRRTFSHVGIYVGDGKFIHSPKPGAQVRVEDMRAGYWQTRFDGARRVLISQFDSANNMR